MFAVWCVLQIEVSDAELFIHFHLLFDVVHRPCILQAFFEEDDAFRWLAEVDCELAECAEYLSSEFVVCGAY